MKSRATNSLLFVANLAAFSFCACIAFARNINELFFQYDGSYMLAGVRDQLNLSQPIFEYSNNFLQSIGNIQFPQNARLLFFFWPVGWFSDPHTAKIATYLVIATMVFWSTYQLGQLLSQPRAVSLTAGWIVGFVGTPFVPIPFFYAILSSAPSFVVIAVIPVIAFWLVTSASRTSKSLSAAMTVLGLLALAFYTLAAASVFLPVVALATATYVALALVLACGRAQLLRKLAILASTLIVMVVLRWPWYVLGLFLETAPNFFPNDFTVVYHDKIFASIMFQKSVLGWGGPSLVAVSAIGALLSLRSTNFELRAAAWMLLALISTFIVAGAALTLMPHWIFPPPIYFEIAVWPLYGIFSTIALMRAFDAVAVLIARAGVRTDYAASPRQIGLATAFVLAAILVSRKTHIVADYPFPPRVSSITAILQADISLGAFSSFKGRILTAMPIKPDGGDAWLQQFYAAADWAKIDGNDEMSVGLWYYRIPTLFEYNQFISPAFHALVKRALQRSPIAHVRNITVLTYPNARVLKLLGVRYVLMPQPDASLGGVRATEDRAGVQWGLIDLPEPNLATYSPTLIETRQDLASALDFVVDDTVDLTKRAVTASPVIGALEPVQSSALAMANEDLHIVAKSAGRSLVIVPVEFSHCIELHEMSLGTGTGAALLRVDGLLTGIVFEHDLDAVLSFRIGPLHNPLCRWQDYQDLRVMLH